MVAVADGPSDAADRGLSVAAGSGPVQPNGGAGRQSRRPVEDAPPEAAVVATGEGRCPNAWTR